MTEDGTSYIEADGFRVYEQGPRPEPEEGRLLQARVRPLKDDGHSFTVSWGFIDAPVGDDWDSWIVRQTPVVTDETYWERYREDPETEVIVLPDSVVAKLFGLPDTGESRTEAVPVKRSARLRMRMRRFLEMAHVVLLLAALVLAAIAVVVFYFLGGWWGWMRL